MKSFISDQLFINSYRSISFVTQHSIRISSLPHVSSIQFYVNSLALLNTNFTAHHSRTFRLPEGNSHRIKSGNSLDFWSGTCSLASPSNMRFFMTLIPALSSSGSILIPLVYTFRSLSTPYFCNHLISCPSFQFLPSFPSHYQSFSRSLQTLLCPQTLATVVYDDTFQIREKTENGLPILINSVEFQYVRVLRAFKSSQHLTQVLLQQLLITYPVRLREVSC